MALENKIVLPIGLISPADVRRLRRSANDLADYLRQLELKNSDEPLPKPRAGLLAEFASANKLDLASVVGCQRAATLLTELSELAPIVHISFADEPSTGALQKILGWFRQNVHPFILINVGLQPSVGAGCYLRTTNRYFDLSLRRRLLDHREILVNQLLELVG